MKRAGNPHIGERQRKRFFVCPQAPEEAVDIEILVGAGFDFHNTIYTEKWSVSTRSSSIIVRITSSAVGVGSPSFVTVTQ